VQLGGGRSISDACGFYRVKEGLKSPTRSQADFTSRRIDLFNKLGNQEFGVGLKKRPCVFVYLLTFLGVEFVDEGV